MNSIDDIRIGTKGHRVVIPKKVANRFADLLMEVRNNPNEAGEDFINFIRDNISSSLEDDVYEDVYNILVEDNKVMLEGFRQYSGFGKTLNATFKSVCARFWTPFSFGPDWTERFYNLLQVNTEMLYSLSTDFPTNDPEASKFFNDCKNLFNQQRYSWCTKVLTDNQVQSSNPFDLDCRNASIICRSSSGSWEWVNTPDVNREGKVLHLDRGLLDSIVKFKNAVKEGTVSTMSKASQAASNAVGKMSSKFEGADDLALRVSLEIGHLKALAEKTGVDYPGASGLPKSAGLLTSARLSTFKRNEAKYIASNPKFDDFTFEDVKNLFEDVIDKIETHQFNYESNENSIYNSRRKYKESHKEETEEKKKEEDTITKDSTKVTEEDMKEFEQHLEEETKMIEMKESETSQQDVASNIEGKETTVDGEAVQSHADKTDSLSKKDTLSEDSSDKENTSTNKENVSTDSAEHIPTKEVNSESLTEDNTEIPKETKEIVENSKDDIKEVVDMPKDSDIDIPKQSQVTSGTGSVTLGGLDSMLGSANAGEATNTLEAIQDKDKDWKAVGNSGTKQDLSNLDGMTGSGESGESFETYDRKKDENKDWKPTEHVYKEQRTDSLDDMSKAENSKGVTPTSDKTSTNPELEETIIPDEEEYDEEDVDAFEQCLNEVQNIIEVCNEIATPESDVINKTIKSLKAALNKEKSEVQAKGDWNILDSEDIERLEESLFDVFEAIREQAISDAKQAIEKVKDIFNKLGVS